MKRHRKTNFSTRIIFVTLLVSLISGLLVGGISVRYMHTYLKAQSRLHIKSMAQIAASCLDGDLLDSIQVGDMWSDDFEKIYRQLQNFTTDEDVESVYTMRLVGDETQFIVDGDRDAPCLVGEVYPAYDKILYAFDGMITQDDKPVKDQWGSFYSAFAPIRNSEGRIVAIVGVDSTIENINVRVRAMVRSLVIIEAICILSCTVLSFIAANRMAQYVEEATKDGLTGMFNRRYAVRCIDEASLENRSFGFLLLDIDHFKEVNDTCGHGIGDSVLIGLGAIMRRHLTKKDIGFRLGGDEFAIYFPEAMTEHELHQLSEKMQEEFGFVLKTYCPSVTRAGLSFGGVIGSGYIPFGELYHNADKLLYQVKEQGKRSCQTMELVGRSSAFEDD